MVVESRYRTDLPDDDQQVCAVLIVVSRVAPSFSFPPSISLSLCLRFPSLPAVSNPPCCSIGTAATYWTFGGVGVVGFVLLLIFMPETKGTLPDELFVN